MAIEEGRNAAAGAAATVVDGTAAAEDADASDDRDAVPVPHPALWHPEKTWKDTIITYLASFLIPLHRLAGMPPHEPNAILEDVRSGALAERGRVAAMRASTTAWRRRAGSDIAGCVLRVPRRRGLLEEWGFGADCRGHTAPPPSHDIAVHVCFPASLLEQQDGVALGEENEFGLRPVELSDIRLLPPEVPLTVFFHGGAFVVGDAYFNWPNFVPVLLEQRNEHLILASVEYSLAPEHPFPTAVEEALTVVAHILETCPDRSVHLSGVSAGGSLAAVAALECFRRYPGRVASALVGTAYLDPRADSLSYFMNGPSSHLPTVGFLRWGWRAYLSLPAHESDEAESEQLAASRAEVLGAGSNRTAWRECIWHRHPAERLIMPQVDLPPGLDAPHAPHFILSTNRADPLLDECLDLLARLRERSARVTHLDHMGTHWSGTEFHNESLGELMEAWANVLFSK